MQYYEKNGKILASCEVLDLKPCPPQDTIDAFLFRRPAAESRAVFRASHPRQLTAPVSCAAFLDPDRLPAGETLPPALLHQLRAEGVRAVNLDWEGWEDRLGKDLHGTGLRVNLAALGDVGSTILLGLRLLGGGVVSSVGICDLNGTALRRWEFETNQILDFSDYDRMPPVEIVPQDRIFECDCFLFAASKGVPPVSSGVRDVRMAQFEANRGLVELYARQARAAGFRGLFAVVSDPVDPLAKAAFLASNTDENGRFDRRGLLPEQISGFGLGVMNARAAYYAKKDPEFSVFLTEGRAFGPNGQGLVIADSIEHYDDARSRTLTELALNANLRMREWGLKPYVAPALSSAAIPILQTLRSQWHYSSVYLGGVYFGCRNRLTPLGVETEPLALPDDLYRRLRDAEDGLGAIL